MKQLRQWVPRLAATSALSVALTLSAGLPEAHARPRWDDAPFSYYANGVSVARVLQDFARSYSLRLDLGDASTSGSGTEMRPGGAVGGTAGTAAGSAGGIPPRLQVRVNGRFNSANPTAFLDQIGSVYGFTWFSYAGVLYVSGGGDIVTRVVDARGGSIGRLHDALSSLGVLDERFGWGEMPERGIALVSGPRRYVELVEQVVAQLPSAAGAQEVRVFRLRHASVLDRSIQYRDKRINTPGLATTLRALILNDGQSSGMNNEALSAISEPLRNNPPQFVTNGSSGSVGSGGSASRYAGAQSGMEAITGMQGGMPPLPPLGIPALSGTSGASIPGNAAPVMPSAMRSGASGNGGNGGNPQALTQGVQQAVLPRTARPSIEADARMNAIIVQDVPDRMPIYEKLIAALDVPTAIIQIQAEILDVSRTHVQELGINWGARAGNVGLGFGSTTSTSAATGGALIGAVAGSAGVLSLVGNAANSFASRLNLLEENGDAKVLATPSILTLDNLGAVLDLSDTFYIQTRGRDVASVTPVTVGTTLNVTPRFVAHHPLGEIELIVDIEDGKILPGEVNGLPVVRKSTIATQTRISQNEALVIAGYNSSDEQLRIQRTPWLSRIPLFGLLFRNKQTNTNRTERLFVIRPTMIAIPDEPGYRAAGVAADTARRTDDSQASAAGDGLHDMAPVVAPIVAPVGALRPSAIPATAPASRAFWPEGGASN